MTITARVREAATWIYLILAAGFTLFVGLLFYGRRKAAEGDATATLRADRDRLREAKESGDDEAVAREWRRSRK